MTTPSPTDRVQVTITFADTGTRPIIIHTNGLALTGIIRQFNDGHTITAATTNTDTVFTYPADENPAYPATRTPYNGAFINPRHVATITWSYLANGY